MNIKNPVIGKLHWLTMALIIFAGQVIYAWLGILPTLPVPERFITTFNVVGIGVALCLSGVEVLLPGYTCSFLMKGRTKKWLGYALTAVPTSLSSLLVIRLNTDSVFTQLANPMAMAIAVSILSCGIRIYLVFEYAGRKTDPQMELTSEFTIELDNKTGTWKWRRKED